MEPVFNFSRKLYAFSLLINFAKGKVMNITIMFKTTFIIILSCLALSTQSFAGPGKGVGGGGSGGMNSGVGGSGSRGMKTELVEEVKVKVEERIAELVILLRVNKTLTRNTTLMAHKREAIIRIRVKDNKIVFVTFNKIRREFNHL